MRRITVAAPVLILAALSRSPPRLMAQVTLSSSQRSAIADSVRRITDSVFAAGRRRDLDRMFSFYGASTTLLHDGKPENWREHQSGARAFYKTLRAVDVHPLDHQIDVLSPTVAVWRGQYAYSFTDTAGHVTAGMAANTWVLVREADGWRIVHVHISDPLPAAK